MATTHPLFPRDEQTIGDLERLCALAREALPEAHVPCFAHLRVASAGRTRDLLLGWTTVTDGPVTVVHWQTAPLAEVFFSTREGEDYELAVADRTLEGTVLARNLLDFVDGALVEVVTGDALLTRRGGGDWRREPPPASSLLRARALGAARPPAPWTVDALDPEQRRAVDLAPRRAVLLLGEAGCGKTTVALHRVAALHRRAAAGGKPFRALVLAPVEGLRRLSESMLARLGVPDADVKSFERWAAVEARRVFPGIPRRVSRDAPPGVARLKRHPALRAAMAKVVARPERPRGATANRDDLHHLFGDRDLMRAAVGASGGALSERSSRDVLEHTRVQYEETTEEASRHVDADRLATVDGLLIDAGTPQEHAGTIDAEDHAVLFALAAMRAAPGATAAGPRTYDCVVLDEAQEFAPLELELIGRALRPGGTLVVAGDEGQQVDPTASFAGWPDAMRELGAASYETVRLAVSYRCPPAVTAVARAALRAEAAPADDGSGAVARLRAPSAFHLMARLVDGLRDLRDEDPDATVAVVCRTPEGAERTARLLARGVPLRLVRGGDFSFAAGVEVTCVQEVKGLEFDHVVIPDADASTYADDRDDARRALYVAMTRASYQLVLAATGSWSRLL